MRSSAVLQLDPSRCAVRTGSISLSTISTLPRAALCLVLSMHYPSLPVYCTTLSFSTSCTRVPPCQYNVLRCQYVVSDCQYTIPPCLYITPGCQLHPSWTDMTVPRSAISHQRSALSALHLSPSVHCPSLPSPPAHPPTLAGRPSCPFLTAISDSARPTLAGWRSAP